MNIQQVLDQVQYGDRLSIVRTNLGRTFSTEVCGPALVHRKSLGIDMFDGEPHVVRDAQGHIWGNITSVEAWRTSIDPIRPFVSWAADEKDYQ